MQSRFRFSLGFIVFGLCGLLSAPARAKDFSIAENGQPRATIVVAERTDPKVKTAAEELQTYLAKISGARLPIGTDAQTPAGRLILVGKSSLTDAMKVTIPSGLTGARREEGFIIVCRGDRLVLAGNDEGPYHGTEYAVYELLNRFGVRWFMPGEFGESVPHKTAVALPELQVREKPDFLMRNWWLHATPELAEQEKRWKLRNKMNPDAMFAVPGDSYARNILPEATYFKTHPEYFALNADGTRNPYLPNLTNPKTVEVAAGIIEDYLRKHPDENSYGFAPDDGLPRDFDPETVKRNQGFVSLGGRQGVPGEMSISEEWIAFVTRVTAEVRKEFPNAYISTNGYANRNSPPQGVKLDDHNVIMFAAIWSCTLHAYDDPRCWQKTRQGQLLQRWCKLCKNVWIYGYNYQMLVSGLTPLPETHKMRRDFPLMKKWGVIGFSDETRNQWAECGIPSRYLRAQLEWKADANVDAILADFYSNWYGDAAAPMRAYNEALENAIENAPLHGHEDRILPFLYTPELLKTLSGHLAEAERIGGDDRVKLHLRADRMIYDHLDAYCRMSTAEAGGKYAEAAKQADRMLEIRKSLHALNPFFIWDDENGYHTGIWYWGATARRDYYRTLADKTSGKTGDLIAICPEISQFRTDPRDEGMYAEWYRTDTSTTDWKPLSTTRPFAIQGYQDDHGFPYVGFAWYRLKVSVPASARGKRVMVYCPVVETEAWCWVNGQYVGHRPYKEAYERPAQVEFDVTDAFKPGQTNEIVFRISTSQSSEQAASGLLSRVFLYTPKQ